MVVRGSDPDVVAVARTVDVVLHPDAVTGAIGMFCLGLVPLYIVGVLCTVVEGPTEPVSCLVPVNYSLIKTILHGTPTFYVVLGSLL